MNIYLLINFHVSYTNLTQCSEVPKTGQSCYGMTKFLASDFCIMCTFSLDLHCYDITWSGSLGPSKKDCLCTQILSVNFVCMS